MRSKIEAVKIVQIPDDDPDLSWLTQDAERLAAYHKGDWHMIGIYAVCDTIIVPAGWNHGVSQHISSGGLWGIESDSGRDHLDQIANQELDQLSAILEAMGFSPEEIAAAIEEERP